VLNKKKLRKQPLLTYPHAVVDAIEQDDISIPLAKSIEDLPLGLAGARVIGGGEADVAVALREERRLQMLASDSVADGATGGETGGGGGTGGVVVLLHQALHAKDVGLVTELAMVAARSHTDMVATIRGLELAYLAQFLRLLGDRVATAGTGSPFHGWIFAILRERGVEIQRAIRAATDAAALPSPTDESVITADARALGLAFKAILAPVLERYRRLTALQGSLAVIHGRSSIFLSTRPAKGRVEFLNNLQEAARPTSQRVVRRTPFKGEAQPDEDEVPEVRRVGHRGKRAAKRVKEALLADAGSEDEDDEAIAAGGHSGKMRRLEDTMESTDEDGDDGASALGTDEEGDDLSDDEEEEGDDGADEGDDESVDDEALAGLAEEDEEDLAPSDDMDEAEDGDFADEEEEGEEGEEGEAEEDEIDNINSAVRRDVHRRQLTVDNDAGDAEGDEDAE
jgi:hypothetical protein